MKITDLLTSDTIELNVEATNKNDILDKAIDLMNKSGVIKDINIYKTGIYKREEESTTGVGDGIAIPHCKSNTVTKPHLVAMVIPKGVEFASLDGNPVNLLFMIAAPDSKDNVHLDVLAKLSTLLMDEEFTIALKAAKTKEEFLKTINSFEKAKDKADLATRKIEDSDKPFIVAATACPTGIAHTYMAQEALEKAADKLNVAIKVETNGSGGQKNTLTPEDIAKAKCVIVAADAYVEMERFEGKRVIQCGTSQAIKDSKTLIKASLGTDVPIYKPNNARSSITSKKGSKGFGEIKQSGFQVFYRHLMSGISHMIPFIIAGGILLAIAYLIDGIAGSPKEGLDVIVGEITYHYDFGSVNIAARIFHMLGGDLALGLMFCIMGGFIANSIAGKPGIVAGFVGAFAATKGQFSLLYFIEVGLHGPGTDLANQLSSTSAGFLGAIIAGFVAGYFVLLLKNKVFNRVPKTIEGVKDMMFIPILSTLFIGIVMILVNVPLAYVNIGIGIGLTKLNDLGLTLLVAALAAGLMAIDMGGPINKATHYFVLGLLTTHPEGLLEQGLMAANIVGIIVPPLGIALATWLFPQKFTKEDRKPSIANAITGCCGITEGAIPYVIKDPIRVITSTVIGAAVGGIVAFAWGAVAIAPEGGWISMLVMGLSFYKGIIATILGSLITAALLGILKKDVNLKEAELGKWKGIYTQFIYNFFANINYLAKSKSLNRRIESVKVKIQNEEISAKKDKLTKKSQKLNAALLNLQTTHEKDIALAIANKQEKINEWARNKAIKSRPEVNESYKLYVKAINNNNKAVARELKLQDKIDYVNERLEIAKKKTYLNNKLEVLNQNLEAAQKYVNLTEQYKIEKTAEFDKYKDVIAKDINELLLAKQNKKQKVEVK